MDSEKQPDVSTKKLGTTEPMVDSPGSSIGSSIDELESLIAETKLPPKLHPEIPVLNDVVDTAEIRRYAEIESIIKSINTPEDKSDEMPIVKLSELVDSVDKKLSDELDALVNVLKDSIKDSILVELKEQLKRESSQIQVPTAHADSPEKPSE